MDATFFCRVRVKETTSERNILSKGRIERERQWGSKVKGSSVLQNISKGISSLQNGCVNLFDSQVGRNKLSLHQLNKGTLVYSQAEGQGPPGKPVCMIVIIKRSQGNKFPTWRQNWLPPCNIVISFPTESEDRDLGDLSEVVRILSFCQGSQHLLTAAA